MDNLKMQSREAVAEVGLNQPDPAFSVASIPHKVGRGRPPGRNRKEIESLRDGSTATETKSPEAETGLAPRHLNGTVGRLNRNRAAVGRANNDKPIFTLSVAAEILHLHPRTLRIYEEQSLVMPTRTQTNRRRYSQNDIKKFQFIQYLTRERGVNLSGVKIILTLLEEIRKTVPEPISHVFPDYGESEGFPLL